MIPLALAHCLLQPGRKQGTNGGAFLGSENTSFPQKFRFDFQCNIGLHICTYSRAALFYVLSSGRSTASTARRELRIVVLTEQFRKRTRCTGMYRSHSRSEESETGFPWRS